MSPGRDAHPAAAASGADRAARVHDLFGGIARRYDLVNRIASFGMDLGWRRQVAIRLEVGDGDWCLDACCGTADLALAVARTGASVLAVDFCRPMLDEARPKIAGRASIRLVQGDALALPLRTGSVDAACVAFGLRNLVDPAAGLRELARVVRPGGRVAVLEFSRPAGALARRLTALHEELVVPRVGDLVSGRRGTYRYLPETIRSWFPPEKLAALMAGAGLARVDVRSMALGAVALHVGTVGAGTEPPGGPTC